MTMQYFVRKPFYVFGFKVTLANMEQVANWCGGKIEEAEARGNKPATRYIQVNVVNPQKDFHSRAYPDNWVLRMGSGFKVYTDRAFKNDFDQVPAPTSAPTDRFQTWCHEQGEDLFSAPVGQDSEKVSS
jgi:hypothetical protein